MASVKPRRDTGDNPGDEGEMSASSAGAAALGQVHELIGKELIGITTVEPVDDGWLVEIEVVEERRVPSSSDMLALYEVELDLDGDLLAYRRTKRYVRGRGDTGTGAS